jgi:hypothetical protein
MGRKTHRMRPSSIRRISETEKGANSNINAPALIPVFTVRPFVWGLARTSVSLWLRSVPSTLMWAFTCIRRPPSGLPPILMLSTLDDNLYGPALAKVNFLAK